MNLSDGLKDNYNSLMNPSKWLYLAYMDVLLRYKRTLLGPWWITLSIGVIILSLSFVWPTVLSVDLSFFVPYFTIGYVMWHWIQSSVLESSSSFIEFEGLLKQIKIPISTYLLRVTTRNFFIFIHNFTLIVIALVFFNSDVYLLNFFLISVPSLLLIFISINSIGVLLAFASIRYRDLINIIGFILQLLFFFTPILWHPSILGKSIALVNMNIIYHWIEIVRQPLLGMKIPDYSFIIIALSTLFLLLLSFIVIGKYQNKFVYWL